MIFLSYTSKSNYNKKGDDQNKTIGLNLPVWSCQWLGIESYFSRFKINFRKYKSQTFNAIFVLLILKSRLFSWEYWSLNECANRRIMNSRDNSRTGLIVCTQDLNWLASCVHSRSSPRPFCHCLSSSKYVDWPLPWLFNFKWAINKTHCFSYIQVQWSI